MSGTRDNITQCLHDLPMLLYTDFENLGEIIPSKRGMTTKHINMKLKFSKYKNFHLQLGRPKIGHPTRTIDTPPI